MTTDAIFGPLSSSRSGERAGTFVRVPDDREGIGRGILGSPTMVSPTVVIASQPERERGLSGRRREGMI